MFVCNTGATQCRFCCSVEPGVFCWGLLTIFFFGGGGMEIFPCNYYNFEYYISTISNDVQSNTTFI